MISKRKIWSRGVPFVVNVPLNLFWRISVTRLITMQLANEGPAFKTKLSVGAQVKSRNPTAVENLSECRGRAHEGSSKRSWQRGGQAAFRLIYQPVVVHFCDRFFSKRWRSHDKQGNAWQKISVKPPATH